MKSPVHAFLSERLYEQTGEELWRQAAETASFEGVLGVFLMPDAHCGNGVPVGSVAVTEGTLIQAAPGYDISCGILLLAVPGLKAVDVSDWSRRERWVQEVVKEVNVRNGPSAAQRNNCQIDLEEILRYGAGALMFKEDAFEHPCFPVPSNVDFQRIPQAYQAALVDLGSLGGGNHFIEMQVDGMDGQVWVMVHSGSRRYGRLIAEDYFLRGAELRKLPLGRKEQSWLSRGSKLGEEYWSYQNSAANYAMANRQIIVQAVQRALEAVFGVRGEVYYEISHNLIQEETLVLPTGAALRGFVHRKGATRAFPPNHPALSGTPWECTGNPCLVPGSMYDGAAILFPLQGAAQTAYSVSHGSGRLIGRGEAGRILGSVQHDIDADMRNVSRMFAGIEIKGIVTNLSKTPLDECGLVYKDLDEVLGVIESEQIAKVVHRVYPVACIKGIG